MRTLYERDFQVFISGMKLEFEIYNVVVQLFILETKYKKGKFKI